MDDMDGEIGGPALFRSAFPGTKGGLHDEIRDKKLTEKESEPVLMSRMDERHSEVLSGKKQVVKFYDARDEKQVSVDLHTEDIQKVQSYIDELKAGGKLQPILVTSEITLADLSNVAILLGWEVGLFLKDRQFYLATSKALKEIDAPAGGYKFVAHSHPTLSDEVGQITGDKEAAKSQLEIAVTAKYTVMIYSKGIHYNVTDEAHKYPTVSSRLDSSKTRMENHRIYFRQPLQVNALEKLGTDGTKVEEVLPQSSSGSSDGSGLFDLLFGADFLSGDEPDDEALPNTNVVDTAKVGGKKPKSEGSSGKSTPSSPQRKSSSSDFFSGFVSGLIPAAEPPKRHISRKADAIRSVEEFFANCTAEEADDFIAQVTSLKAKNFDSQPKIKSPPGTI